MSDFVKLESIQKLVQQAPQFNDLNPGQQAAYRATLTRFLGRVSDPQIKAVLQKLAEFVGTSKPPYRGLTVQDIEQEYRDKYAGYTSTQRGAFKAKITRLHNSLQEAGNEAAARQLAGVKFIMNEAENRDLRASILSLAEFIPTGDEEE